MTDFDGFARMCWARAATERFDVEGTLELTIEVADQNHAHAEATERGVTPALTKCMTSFVEHYSWDARLIGQTFRLPFKFTAPDGQSVIDRDIVDWHGQGDISIAVLLDENNTGNANASMFEVAFARGGSTGLRWADRAELWYFLEPAEVSSVAGGTHAVAAGDMMYAPKGSAREIKAPTAAAHAVVILVPGGREGTARAGALPNREAAHWTAAPMSPTILPASSAKTFGPATIYLDASIDKDAPLAAELMQLGADAKVPEHVHAHETEMLYVLAGAGTMTVAGTDVPVTATSVVQIPPNTLHAFHATAALRAVQIYTPGGPEQRFKKPPKP
jgi:quercetin dioxygenase-like cupin family protein